MNKINFLIGQNKIFNNNDSSMIASVYDHYNRKFIISYRDLGDHSNGKSIIGTVSGDNIIFDDPVTFSDSNVVFTSSAYDSKTQRFAVAYRDYRDNDRGKVVVGKILSTTNKIHFGSPITFCKSQTDFIDIASDPINDKFVMVCQDAKDGRKGKANVGYTFGETIVVGSQATYCNGSYVNFNKVLFDSNSGKMIVFYREGSDSGRGKVIVGHISKQIISFPSKPMIFTSGIAQYLSPVMIYSGSKFIVAFSHKNISIKESKLPFKNITRRIIPQNNVESITENGKVALCEIIGSELIVHDVKTFSSGENKFISTTLVEQKELVLVSYSHTADGGRGKICALKFSGNKIDIVGESVFNDTDTNYISSSYNNTNDNVLIAFQSGNMGRALVVNT